MNHIFICEKSEEERRQVKTYSERNVACRTELKLMCASTNSAAVLGSRDWKRGVRTALEIQNYRPNAAS